MEKPPMEWIDKLFECMQQFYGERWTDRIGNFPEPFYKVMWQSALYGCTHEQIRNVLVYLKRAAQNPLERPPHQLEFFRYIKTNAVPVIDYQAPIDGGRSEFAKRTLDEINEKLRYRRKPVDVSCETVGA